MSSTNVDTTGETEGNQVAWVFDLNKCIGCGACTSACDGLWTTDEDMTDQWWCTVETKPSEGHPRGWSDMGGGYDEDGNLVLGDPPTGDTVHDQVSRTWDPEEATSGENIEVPMDDDPEWMFNWEEDEGAGEHPNSWHFYLPKICMHCSKPSCVEACPESAIVKRQEDGVVVIDENACDGNRFCQRACPYKVIWFNEDRGTAEIQQPETPAADGGTPTMEGSETLTHDGISQKCHGCIPRIEEDVAPACARSCPTRAVHFGNMKDTDGSVYKLVEEWGVALPLLPQANTGPNVYYVPPMSAKRLDDDGRITDEPRIPDEYLRSLFGDRVEEALATIQEEREKVENGGESELIDLLVGYRWPDDFFGSFTDHPQDTV